MLERFAGRIMLQSGWRRALTAFLAGAFAVLALPPFDFFAAMFVSFPVLVWLLDGASPDPDRGFLGRCRPSFACGWWFGFGYFVAGLWWLGAALLVEADSFAWAIPLAVLGLPALLAIFFGLGTTLARAIWSDGFGRIAALAFGLTIAEWLRSFAFTGFPWNTIGYGAMPVPLAMQSVTVVGLIGVTLLAIVVFSVPALVATRRGLFQGLSCASVIVAAHLGFGAYELSQAASDAAGANAAIVRIVQPSIPQEMKWSAAERDAIFNAHLELTNRPPEVEGAVPSLIVWPETSVPYILTEAPRALGAIAEALDDGQHLAAGAVRVDDSRPAAGTRYYNSITVIGDGGEITAAADKVHLVPFGEYLPFEDFLTSLGLSAIAETPQGFSAAAERTLLDIGETITALPLICYEAIFPLDLAAIESPPDIILNVTNDAWYGATPGPYQHFRQAQIRALETRTPMVRAANNGISAVTDSYGRIVDGLALNAVGVIDAPIPERVVPNWNRTERMRNLWLLIGMILFVAIVSRASFNTQ
ncbi:apolipoprotein N-acyltransferase [Pararhizobium haloflavum]|uniref:apolipoprotein N-acyltransferase n=1 Tax=Pararhizobium haloflavum TaxID=2037914 RepID=UPI00351FD3F0